MLFWLIGFVLLFIFYIAEFGNYEEKDKQKDYKYLDNLVFGDYKKKEDKRELLKLINFFIELPEDIKINNFIEKYNVNKGVENEDDTLRRLIKLCRRK